MFGFIPISDQQMMQYNYDFIPLIIVEFKDFSAAGSEIRQLENSAGSSPVTSGTFSDSWKILPENFKMPQNLSEVPEKVAPPLGSSVNVRP